MGITIYDVASAAGVSPATVSRVLAGGAAVAPETAGRVRSVVERLGYRPDRVAQSLRRQRSGMVGLLLPIEGYPASLPLIRKIEQTLSALDISLLLADSSMGTDRGAARRLVEQGVDALLWVRTRPVSDNGASFDDDIPIVLVDSGNTGGSYDSVRVDHAAGIRQVVRFLAKEGAARFAFLGEGSASIIGTEQLEGFAEATSAVPRIDTAALRLGPATTEFGQATAKELLGLREPPDAFVCGSDVVAAAVCAVLQSDDADDRPLVAGYGGAAWSRLLSPSLTTVRLPAAEVAEEAIRLVMRRLDGLDANCIDIALPPSLVLLEST